MFKNVDGPTILIAVVTGVAMTALIWLSVMFARYRKRNQVVVMLEGGMEVAKQAVADVEAWPERIGAVTVEQIKAAAKAVLKEGRSVTSYLLGKKTG